MRGGTMIRAIHLSERNPGWEWAGRCVWTFLLPERLFWLGYSQRTSTPDLKHKICPAVLGLVAQLCPALCDPMDCDPPGSSVHGDSPGKHTGVGCLALLYGIFPTQGSNSGLQHCKQILYRLSHQGTPPVLLGRPYLKPTVERAFSREGINREQKGGCEARCQILDLT